MRYIGLVTLGALALSATSASAAVNLITDGTFNEGGGVGLLATYSTGSAVGTGSPWTVGGSVPNDNAPTSVDLIGTYWAGPPGGGFSVDLDGSLNTGGSSGAVAVGSISESVLVPTTGKYVLSFYVSGNQDGGSPTKDYSVSIDGYSSPVLTTTNTVKDGQWTLVTEAITLTAGSDTITFASLDTPESEQYGAVIGNVSLTAAVPEASTWAMLGLGFACLGFTGFRAGKRRPAALAAD